MKEYSIRKIMERIIEVLEKKHAIKMLLLIFDEVAYKEKLRSGLQIPVETVDARLKDFIDAKILKEPIDQQEFPFKRIYPLTEMGEQIARKLNYVFDEIKECIPITKGTYKTLKETIELYESKFITIEAFVNELIRNYLKSPK